MMIRRLVSIPVAFLLGCSAGDPADTQHGPDAHGTGADVIDTTDASFDSDARTAIPIADGGSVLCLTDSDCDNGNTCTTSHCSLVGEIGTCEYTPVAEGASCGGTASCPATCVSGVCHAQTCAGTDAGTGQPGVDPMCPDTCPYARITPVFPPFTPLLPPGLPASCSNGFELGGANGGCGGSTYSIHSTRPGGANAVTLAIDFATYLVPDGVTISRVDSSGHTFTLLRTCRLQTWNSSGPSTMRPPDESIRQFRLDVPAGTTELDFDFGPVTSPMYMQVLGLCDFTLTPFAHAAWWQPVP